MNLIQASNCFLQEKNKDTYPQGTLELFLPDRWKDIAPEKSARFWLNFLDTLKGTEETKELLSLLKLFKAKWEVEHPTKYGDTLQEVEYAKKRLTKVIDIETIILHSLFAGKREE